MYLSRHVVVAGGWLAATPAEVAEPARAAFGRIGYLAMFGSTDQT